MKKNLFFTLATAALLASCSSENDELFNTTPEGQSDELTEIKLSGTSLSVDADSSQKKVATRTAFEGQPGTDNELLALVPLSTKSKDYSSTHQWDGEHGTVSFKGQDKTGFTQAKHYPALATTPIYMVGLYPADEWETLTTTATHTIDGKTDLMFAPEQTTTKANAANPPTLTFYHLLTKLNIVLKGASTDDIDAWGEITELKLAQSLGTGLQTPPNSVTVTLGDNAEGENKITPSYTGEATGGLNCYKAKTNDAVTTGTSLQINNNTNVVGAYVLAPPVSASTGSDYKLLIKTTKHTESIEKEINLMQTNGTTEFTGDTMGKAFTITLNFKASVIEVKATVNPWEEGGKADIDIQ